jgi:hypothetical protein
MSPEKRRLALFANQIKLEGYTVSRAIEALSNFLNTGHPWTADSKDWLVFHKVIRLAYAQYGPEYEFMCHQDHFHPMYEQWLKCLETTSSEIRVFVEAILDLLKQV